MVHAYRSYRLLRVLASLEAGRASLQSKGDKAVATRPSRRLSGYGIGASQEPSESASGEEPGRHAAWSLLVRDPREQPHKGALYRIADGCWLTGMILLLTQVEVIEDPPRHAVARA